MRKEKPKDSRSWKWRCAVRFECWTIWPEASASISAIPLKRPNKRSPRFATTFSAPCSENTMCHLAKVSCALILALSLALSAGAAAKKDYFTDDELDLI